MRVARTAGTITSVIADAATRHALDPQQMRQALLR
jgi:hypothetical protein